jgi:hypothetical protein
MHKFGVGLRCVAAFCILASLEGCRSTRNSLSSIPGMGWMANKEPNVSDWETDGALPTKPTTEATPLVASRSKPKSDSLNSDKAATRSEANALAERSERVAGETKSADAMKRSTSQVAEAGTAKRDKYDTGRYDTGKAATEAKSGAEGSSRGGAVASTPKRGFYGNEYSEEVESTERKASATAPRASSELAAGAGSAAEESAESARSYSRFSQRVVPAAGETLGREASREELCRGRS